MNIFNNQKIVLTLTKMDGSKISISKKIKEELQVYSSGHLEVDGENLIRTLRDSDKLKYLLLKFENNDTNSSDRLIVVKSLKPKNPHSLSIENISEDLDDQLRKIVYEKMMKAFNEYISGEPLVHLDLDYRGIAQEVLSFVKSDQAA